VTSRALEPLWHRTAHALKGHAASNDDAEQDFGAGIVDAVVVGAGVTGLSTALHLAERGARVVVLERDAPGMGSTGRSNGQVIAGLQQPPQALVDAFGDEAGERLVAFAGAAPDLLFGLIERCGLDALEKIERSWADRGAHVRMLDRGEVARYFGTRVYAGGWLDERCGTIQPYAYALGLAAAAARAGARIVRGVEVRAVRRHGEWHVATNRGVVRASAVVLATNVATTELEGAAKQCLGRTYLSAYSVQLATEPLDRVARAEVLPRGHAGADTSHLRLRYFRLDADGRFVIGGPGWLTPPRSARATSFRVLERAMRRMFPALRDVRVESRWFARDTLTPDLLPHLYEPCPGLHAALGFNGRGLAIGTALGSVLARRVLGEPAESLPFPTTSASNVPFALPAAVKFHLAKALARFRH
jgi:glycine/D-amino acid oxidase-like deaminating enzyme